MDFTDQVALITGGSRGIGAACARQFAEAGAHVGLVYRSHDEEAREVQAAVEALGRKALLLQGDVASLVTARDHVQQVAAAFGRLDVLVNNAGIWTALTTTAAGLAVALVAYFLTSWLDARIERERNLIEVLISAAIHGRVDQSARQQG